MGKINKIVALLLTLTIIMSCLTLPTVKPANALSIPKPAIPEFTVELVQKVIDEAPTYTIDPYSGETIIKTNGYHTSYWVVDIKIKNNTPDIYYNYRIKGLFATEWSICPLIDNGNGVWTTRETSPFTFVPIPTYAKATSSDYTEVKVDMQSLKTGDKVDVQVQAILGTIADAPNGGYQILTGQCSDWSNTQTVTIGQASISTPNPTLPITSTPTTATPTSTPITPNTNVDSITLPLNVFISLVAVLVAVILALLILAVRHRKAAT